MGFSDSATYIRSDDTSDIGISLVSLLKRLDFVLSSESQADDYIPSYEDPRKLKRLIVWVNRASPQWCRLYSNAPGLFTWHDGDGSPFLQNLAKQTGSEAFEICVDDGDSMCVMETTGDGYRLTGAHSYVIDELFERDQSMAFTPGSVFQLKGVQLSYASLEVETAVIKELVDYDFRNSVMDEAIADFETAQFGRKLDSYYDVSVSDADAKWYFERLSK